MFVVCDVVVVWWVFDDDLIELCMVVVWVVDYGIDFNVIGGELWI